MTVRRAPTYARPGQPEGAWWHPLAYLSALAGAGMVGWALLIGAGWLVWLAGIYAVFAFAVVLAMGVVTFAAWLLVKGNARARVLGVVILAALAWLVVWVVQR